jgi:hypothetical protein
MQGDNIPVEKMCMMILSLQVREKGLCNLTPYRHLLVALLDFRSLRSRKLRLPRRCLMGLSSLCLGRREAAHGRAIPASDFGCEIAGMTSIERWRDLAHSKYTYQISSRLSHRQRINELAVTVAVAEDSSISVYIPIRPNVNNPSCQNVLPLS